jgi:protein-ribulosamine 3-kinase
MTRGEHASLNALHDIEPSLCPQSLSNGLLADGTGSYLVTEFLDMDRTSISATRGKGPSLAAKLAKVHSTPAPVPEGLETRMFGFPVPTCCGSTEQANDYQRSWAEFYAENRLRAILNASEKSNGPDEELRNTLEITASKVVPRLLGDDHLGGSKGVVPVVVHGDLWSGNKGKGVIGSKGGSEDVVFDPSSCYAHAEYEHGIMRMFGGFGRMFWDEYWNTMDKTEPKEEYDDRLDLYEL